MKVKSKRYYIDKSELNKIIFVSSGRANKFVSNPELGVSDLLPDGKHLIDSVEIQEPHSLTGWNAQYLEATNRNLVQCGLDIPYQFFWSKCCKPINPHHTDYSHLFLMLNDQKN